MILLTLQNSYPNDVYKSQNIKQYLINCKLLKQGCIRISRHHGRFLLTGMKSGNLRKYNDALMPGSDPWTVKSDHISTASYT